MSIYRFGPFELRTRAGELYKFGTKIHLRGQPLQFLRLLLSRPSEVMTREEVRDHLWPSGTFVDFEHGINATLRKLRQALGESAVKPLYIETLPGLGYRFIAPLETVEEPPASGTSSKLVRLRLPTQMMKPTRTGISRPAPTQPGVNLARMGSPRAGGCGRRGWAFSLAAKSSRQEVLRATAKPSNGSGCVNLCVVVHCIVSHTRRRGIWREQFFSSFRFAHQPRILANPRKSLGSQCGAGLSCDFSASERHSRCHIPNQRYRLHWESSNELLHPRVVPNRVRKRGV